MLQDEGGSSSKVPISWPSLSPGTASRWDITQLTASHQRGRAGFPQHCAQGCLYSPHRDLLGARKPGPSQWLNGGVPSMRGTVQASRHGVVPGQPPELQRENQNCTKSLVLFLDTLAHWGTIHALSG